MLNVDVFPDRLDVSKLILVNKVEIVDASFPPTGGNTVLLKKDVFPDRLDASKLILVNKVEIVDASLPPPPLGRTAVLNDDKFLLIVEFT